MAGLAEIVSDPNYVSANAETKAAIFEKHAPTDPNFANANPETQAAIRAKFGVTTGGAAVGNPTIQRQGERAFKGRAGVGEMAADIGGAAGVGALLGAAGPEIMFGLGNAAGAFPATAPMRAPLMFMGNAIRAAGRPTAAAAGAFSGAVGETAGQTAETIGAGPTTAEITRIVAGGVGPELKTLAVWGVKKGLGATGVTDIVNGLKTLAGKEVKLSEAQQKYLESEVAALRGGAKSNEPLEQVGSIMGAEGQRLMSDADQRLIAAQQQAAGVKPTGAQSELADIGGNLRATIVTRNEDAIKARRKQYLDTEKARDAIVSASEGNGRYVNSLPEYGTLVSGLKAELAPGKRSKDVQGSIQKIVDELEPKGGPVSFQAIDDVRRKLGEVFEGKPSVGYEALNDARGKALYAKLTELQKKFAGGENGPHAKLLEDYHAQSEALGQFRTKLGKKATALDQYQEGEFATDPSALPGVYFKTRASVQSLKELTGNPNQVNHAALEYANKQLAGKNAAEVNQWMTKNSEWLAEVVPTRSLVERYAAKLQASEASMRNATEFAAQAGADANLLIGKHLPAQRAVDLITKGNAELWDKVTPTIVASPQAKQQMVSAVRQVVADQASARATTDLFSRNIRPFLERSGIATTAEMDMIAQRLTNIAEMKIPETEKLGLTRRLLLQSSAGWASSASARTGVGLGKSMANLVPE